MNGWYLIPNILAPDFLATLEFHKFYLFSYLFCPTDNCYEKIWEFLAAGQIKPKSKANRRFSSGRMEYYILQKCKTITIMQFQLNKFDLKLQHMPDVNLQSMLPDVHCHRSSELNLFHASWIRNTSLSVACSESYNVTSS